MPSSTQSLHPLFGLSSPISVSSLPVVLRRRTNYSIFDMICCAVVALRAAQGDSYNIIIL